MRTFRPFSNITPLRVSLLWSSAVIALGLAMPGPASPALAQGIELILKKEVAVPSPRPDTISTGSVVGVMQTSELIASSSSNPVAPVAGSLKDGFSALGRGEIDRALGIRAGMKPGSLDRKILAWAIAVSGKKGVRSGTIADIQQDLSGWPGQEAMRRNSEQALVRENLPANRLVALFSGKRPETTEASIALAEAHLATGNRSAAYSVIAPLWHNETLEPTEEAKILASVGSVLGTRDHQKRMHMLYYRDRVESAEHLAAKSEQFSLAKARSAAVRNSSNAAQLIRDVAPSSKKDAGYLFARIEHARRTENWKLATELLLGAPNDPAVLVNADEWWVERRIVSRKLVEQGQFKTAYKIAANHSAQSASDIIEAEFHAGWYALRYLNDRGTAQRHFAKMLEHSTLPISIARSHYWMGRAATGSAASTHYKQAGVHQGTFYGQLALHELGQKKLVITKPAVSSTDRSNFENREMVRVIRRLDETGNEGWANGFYLHLARTLNSPGELAILSANAEQQGNFQLALQIGKIANGRGLAVDTLAWPIGAIPGSAKIRADDMALAYAISRQESAFNKAAVSPANARGLMQLLPGTAKAVARKRGYTYSHARLTQDAAYNATLGTAYLNDQMAEFGNSYVLTFIAYNAGPRRVGQWIERFGDPRGKPLYDVIDWVEMIPYSETRHYVQRVLENYQVYKARIAGSGLTLAQDLTRGR